MSKSSGKSDPEEGKWEHFEDIRGKGSCHFSSF